MSNKKLETDLQNCFLDLKRAATSFYLNPKGKTWQVFLDHALKILQEKKKFQKFTTKIAEIKEKANCADEKQVKNLADEMLTWGILIKSEVG